MREAIGNSYLVSISIVLLFLIMAMLVASLSYSKAYKAKNKIISIIEKYDGYTVQAETDVYADLKKMGYKLNTTDRTCALYDSMTLLHNTTNGKYDYCLYSVITSRGTYYHVVAYMHFDLPIVGQYITIPIKGDSRTIYRNLEG